MKRLSWDNLHVLLAVIRCGNLGQAARRLRLSTATLSRRLDVLEEQLGGQLLERTATGCIATALGQRICTLAEQMEGAANDILREVERPEAVDGMVRINADEWLSFLVTALLAPIRQRHPLLDVEVATSVAPSSLARREADLSLRYAAPGSADLLADPLGTLEFGLYASSRYIDLHPHAIERQAWAELDFVGLDDSREDPAMRDWWANLPGAPTAWLRCSYMLGVYDGVLAGAGLGIIERQTADLTPNLVLVREAPELTRQVWLCAHRSMRDNARVKAVKAFLMEAWPG